VTFVISLAMAQAPTCRTTSSRVEGVIESKVRELKGHELCQFRLYDRLNDVDADGQNDFLMVFSVEGINGSANATRQFLVAFPSANNWRPSLVEVGRRGVRTVLKLDVEGRTVVLTTAEAQKGDALCCPSGSGRIAFRLEQDKLVAASESAK
jgi:hypothetical protein